jgi:hypothetical protein
LKKWVLTDLFPVTADSRPRRPKHVTRFTTHKNLIMRRDAEAMTAMVTKLLTIEQKRLMRTVS